ncbi:uncharacterized protein LOC115964686 [Quercus lobata]|uniref:uncharacterized protein LOC115964686 n=1 Tax=Quercus lobata TaxID=97700 RepID=UPI001247B053|nr:uncharacterized protein LOC115964686 [Quercus lobata]
MGAIVEEYFQSIFTSSEPSKFESILQGIHPAISKDVAGFLSCEFHADEDVTAVVLKALNLGVILESLNSTFIALIPKVKQPRKSAFLSERLISDNVLVTFETLHYLKRKTQGKLGYMALKLDMSKAYNWVELEFLEKTMRHLGLEDRMPVGSIKPERGLCQGDPLSPYLFLKCATGLQSLLHTAKMEGHIQGVAICRNGPRVSHLFFADDSVLFCRAKEEECQKILDILATYERGLGQKINRDKTNIFFSTNTSSDMQSCIQIILGVLAIRQYEKYLDLPAFVGRAKKQSFIYIKERVWKKTSRVEAEVIVSSKSRGAN